MLAVLGVVRDRRNHGPEGNVHHRIGDAPENVDDREVDQQAGALEVRRRKQRVQDEGVQHGTGPDPRPEASPLGMRLGDDDAHEGIVGGVEDAGDQQDQADVGGGHSENVLVVVHDIGGRQRIDHVLADGAQAVGGCFPGGEFRCLTHDEPPL